MDPLHRLEALASSFDATLTVNGRHAAGKITLALPSGQLHVFALYLTDGGGNVSVREDSPGSLLPAFCPDRHINADSSFCLGWGEDNPTEIHNMEAARQWWSAVARFLAHQISANKRLVWPGRENDRAHGVAAQHQAVAEQLAVKFGPAFVDDLRDGELTVRLEKRRRNPRLELYRRGRLISRAFLNSMGLKRDRFPCPCNEVPPVPIIHCSTHAEALAQFMAALYNWREEECNFLKDLAAKGGRCCGTLRECGLATVCASAKSSSKGFATSRPAISSVL